MIIEKINIKEVKMNPQNPRIIKNDKFRKLVKSIKGFPEMLEVRPIVVDENMIVLGGNMRLKACLEAGLEEVHIIRLHNLDEEKKKEFIVKDNVGYGEWDWEILHKDENWDIGNLVEWGLDIVAEKVDLKEGDYEFNQGIDFESNYIVLKFDSDIDWVQAHSLFELKMGYNKLGNGRVGNKGLGRVVNGIEAIEKIKNNNNNEG